VAAGGGKICAITDVGRLECWAHGAVLDERELARETDEEGPYREVALGTEAMCIIDAAGQGKCWGWRIGTDREPRAALGAVTQIRAGTAHGCGLRTDGTVTCVGDARPPPNIRFRQLSRPNRTDNYCGLRMDGRGYCWGDPSADPWALVDRRARVSSSR
jgi:hypothetical protein